MRARAGPGAGGSPGLNGTHLLETAWQGSPPVSRALSKTMCFENTDQGVVIIRNRRALKRSKKGGLVKAGEGNRGLRDRDSGRKEGMERGREGEREVMSSFGAPCTFHGSGLQSVQSSPGRRVSGGSLVHREPETRSLKVIRQEGSQVLRNPLVVGAARAFTTLDSCA